MKILIYQPTTIYISIHDGTYSGGFDSSLSSDGWKQEDGVVKTSWTSLSQIWKKTFTNNGLTTITLPALTKELIGVIFVEGNNLNRTYFQILSC